MKKDSKAKVVGINSKYDEQGRILPIDTEKEKAEVTYLEEQMPIKVEDNIIVISLISGKKVRKDKNGRILSKTELTPEEKARVEKELSIRPHKEDIKEEQESMEY